MLNKFRVLHKIWRWWLSKLSKQDYCRHEFHYINHLVFCNSVTCINTEKFENTARFRTFTFNREIFEKNFLKSFLVQNISVLEFGLVKCFFNGRIDFVWCFQGVRNNSNKCSWDLHVVTFWITKLRSKYFKFVAHF